MQAYLFKDCFRLEGKTGSCVETEFERDFIKYDKKIYLPTAKRQFVSFQIGVESDAELKDFDISFSDLSSEGNKEVIKNANYDIFVEWCHTIKDKLIPDMLIPFKSGCGFNIPLNKEYHKEQKAGALWVDLFIPEETKAGAFSGTLKLSANGDSFEFGIEIEVFDLVTPEKSRITADMNNYADCVSKFSQKLQQNPDRYHDGSLFEYERKLAALSREHRALFHQLPYKHSGYVFEGFIPELEGEGKDIRVKSWDLFDKHFGPYLDGSAFKGSRVSERPIEYLYSAFSLLWPANYEKFGFKGYRTEYRRILSEFVRHFEEKGWTETIYEIILNNKKDYRYVPYTTDEIWYEHDEESVDLFYDIIKDIYNTSKAKFVWRMDSSNHYGNHFDHRFSDYCEMWVAGQAMFSWYPESVPVMKNKGNIVFIYGGVLKHMDQPLLGTTCWPFYCFMTGADGFCAWNTSAFGDYLTTPAWNGGQTVYYPGEFFGLDEPLPSLRSKALRNAMQLNDIIMLTNGTKFGNRLQKIVNEHFKKSSMSEWWAKKPDFVDTTPPRYWDFGESFRDYCMPPLEKGLTPLTIENMTPEVYKTIMGVHGKHYEKPEFQYF